VTRISALTGKESRAFIVRRNVLGCLSRDGGPRGEVRSVMSKEERREGGGGRKEGGRGAGGGEGGGEREKSAGWRTRPARVLEDNKHGGYDLHRVGRH
jgi:hypothetical protein